MTLSYNYSLPKQDLFSYVAEMSFHRFTEKNRLKIMILNNISKVC